MSQVKQCRNCNSTDLYQYEVDHGPITNHLLLPVTGLWEADPVKFQMRICGDCGLYEWFVAPEHLSAVKERLKRLV